ncbi:MAG: enoyl-CoA hydratase/isomerase family protein [Pirellulaceae bacterium]|nr:enoyl-CoA hydratase/isomerase family protein [Pirellulaceae bacterium]
MGIEPTNASNLILTREIEPGIQLVTMANGKVNAMNLEFCNELDRVLATLADDADVKVVILTGNSRVFSAGVDLKRLVAEPLEYVDEFLPAIRQMFLRVVRFPKPLISAISGHALAGGCVVASGGDYRVLARGAQIGMPELRVGLALPAEGLETFRFAVSPQFFQQVVTSGASFMDEAALEAGLADSLASPEEVLTEATAIAKNYLQIPDSVFRLTKSQIRKTLLERIRETNAAFGKEVAALWRDPLVRKNVAEFVTQRLSKPQKKF